MTSKSDLPVTKDDVIATLNDPRLRNIKFLANQLLVSVDGYQRVCEYIERGLILVRPGTDEPFYDRFRHEIILTPSSRPLDDSTKSQIVHECTHAWAHITGIKIRTLADEAAAYLAEQAFYWMGKSVLDTALGPDVGPVPPVPPHAGKAVEQQHKHLAFAHLMFTANQLVVKYKLNTPAGLGATIQDKDIWDLAVVINMYPKYSKIKWNDVDADVRLPLQGNSMWVLREAMRRSRIPGAGRIVP